MPFTAHFCGMVPGISFGRELKRLIRVKARIPEPMKDSLFDNSSVLEMLDDDSLE